MNGIEYVYLCSVLGVRLYPLFSMSFHCHVQTTWRSAWLGRPLLRSPECTMDASSFTHSFKFNYLINWINEFTTTFVEFSVLDILNTLIFLVVVFILLVLCFLLSPCFFCIPCFSLNCLSFICWEFLVFESFPFSPTISLTSLQL